MFRRRPPADPWSEESRADDAEAEILLARTAPGLHRARRIAHGVLIVCLFLVPASRLALLILDTHDGPLEVAGAIGISTFALGVAAFLTWAALADLDTRVRRAASRHWLDTAPRESRRRGLPRPFYRSWWEVPPGHRLLAIAAYLGAGAGIAGLIAAVGAIIEGWHPALVLLAVPGSVLVGLAAWFAVVHVRKRQDDRAWLALAAAPRHPV